MVRTLYETPVGTLSALPAAIAGTSLDYIEAFTPAPDTDMTLGAAREAWPGKVLWLNFRAPEAGQRSGTGHG